MPRRPHLTGRGPAAALLVVLLLVVSGCGGGPVKVADADVPADLTDRCADIIAGLPVSVGNQDRRDVAGAVYGAAWGDPPIVLRCGVGVPTDFTRTSVCQRANGIDWFVPEDTLDDLSRDVTMTTIGRLPALEVSVPARYRPNSPGNVMIDLEPIVVQYTVQTGSCS